MKKSVGKKDSHKIKIAAGEEDEDIYRKTGRDELLEDDEISPSEEGFMEGEDHEGDSSKCAFCGAALTDVDEIIEEEIDDRMYMFCSNRHAEYFKKKKKGKSQLED
jgi:ribosomal protein L24E